MPAPTFASLTVVCQTGVDAEIVDAKLYDTLKPSVDNADTQSVQVFTNLQAALLAAICRRSTPATNEPKLSASNLGQDIGVLPFCGPFQFAVSGQKMGKRIMMTPRINRVINQPTLR